MLAVSSRRGGAIGGRARVLVARRLLLPGALAAALAAACTTTPEPAPSAVPAPPAGAIVAFTQDASVSPLVAFDVRSSTVRPLGQGVRDPAASVAAATGDGLLGVVVSARGRATVLRLVGDTTTPLGPPLEGPREADYRSLSVAGGRVLVADCRAVSVLDTSGASSWRTIGRGCWGTLSPDGSRAVFSPDGRTVVETAAAGGETSAYDLADAVDLGVPEPPRLFGAPAWGEAGIAFTAIAGDQAGVFLRRPGGEIVPLLQEKLLKTARPPILTWRPDGGLLAMMDDLGSGGALRTFDPVTGAHRVVALDALAFEGLLWSPDGSSLATLTSAGALLVVGTDDVWRSRVETTWNAMLGWAP